MHGDYRVDLYLVEALGSEKSNDEEINLEQQEKFSVLSLY